MDNSLDGINIVSDHNQLSLAFFNKSGHVVKTKLDVDWLGSLAGTTSFSSLLKTELLLLFGLGLVLSEQLEELGS